MNSPLVYNASLAKFLTSLGWKLKTGEQFLHLTVDPSAGAGVAAPASSLGVRNNAGTGELWLKTGAADTSWSKVAAGAGTSWSLTGNSGLVAGTNFLGTTDGVDLVFKTNNTEVFRFTAAGAYDTTFSTGILHSDASGILTSSAVNLASVDVTGILPLANGGTGANITPVAGALVYSTGSVFALSAAGSTGQAAISGGTGSPTWFAPTLGSVIFAGISGALTENNANLFWDNTNFRLGIKTASPTGSLSFDGSSTRLIDMTRQTSGAAGQTLNIRASSATVGGTDLNGGTVNIGGGISTGTGSSTVSFSTATPQTSTGTSDNAISTKVTISGVGNLGIGTTTPGAPLSVVATRSGTPGTTGSLMDFSASTFTDSNTAGSGTAAAYTSYRLSGNTLAATNTLVTTTIARTMTIGPIIPGTNETIVNSVGIFTPTGSIAGAGSATNAYGLLFQTISGATNNYGVSVANNSGFGGVTDPLTMLEIATSGVTVGTSEQICLRSQRAAIATGNLIGGVSYRSNDTNLTAPGTVVAYESAVAETSHTASTLTTGLSFAVTNVLAISEAMRIAGNGNVGIGITIPTARLYVVKTVTDAASTDYCSRVDSTQTFTGNSAIGTYANYTRHIVSTASTFTNSAQQIGNYIDVTNGGLAGINTAIVGLRVNHGLTTGSSGTVTSSYGLYVAPTYQAGTVTTGYGLYLSAPTTGGTIGTEYSIFSASTTGRNYFASTVGIGIGGAANKLHIDAGTGTASYAQWTAGTTTGQGSSDGLQIGIDSTGAAEIRQRENLGLKIFTNNTQAISIDNAQATTFAAGITGTTATMTGALRSNTSLILEDPGAGTNTYTIQAPTLAGSLTWTLPTTAGSSGQFLQTNGSGVLTFAAASGSSTPASYDALNLSLATSVAGSALTIALKDQSGADPSAGSPVTIGFRNATSATGTFLTRTVTGALSLVISSGSTLGFASGVNQYIYIYAIDTGAGVVLGASGVVFDEGTVRSSTAEGGAGAADSINVLYSTASQSNKPIRLIGRLLVNEATAGTWASNASEVSVLPYQTQTVGMRYHASSSSISGSFADVTYNTKDKDTHNSYSGATYTIPIDGWYNVSAGLLIQATWTAGQEFDIAITKNGTISCRTRYRIDTAATSGRAVKVQDGNFYSAGDTITIQCLSEGTSPVIQSSDDQNTLSIVRFAGIL